jgi:hypothetical protein
MKGWPPERVEELRILAATNMPASAIAAKLGVGHMGTLIAAAKAGIAVVAYTPEEMAVRVARKKSVDCAKYQRWRKRHGMPITPATAPIIVRPGTSRTSAVYRNQLPGIDPEMSKDRLRAIIAEACRNTAEMQINA